MSSPVRPPAGAFAGGRAPERTLARSARLLKGFRLEQSDPDRFYDLLSEDAVRLLRRWVDFEGLRVLDVGGGAGYLAAACRSAGALCAIVEPSVTELWWRGNRPPGAVVGDGSSLPVRGATADLVLCSNVLEHTPAPQPLCAELVRVARPGGLVWISFTNWYSPWGGHETSPWHYAGGEYAARRFRRRRGRDPKNRFGETLFPLHVGAMLRWARSHPDLEVLDARPRYHPDWARRVVAVPGLREVVTWNLELLLRRRSGRP
jgi:SAM-dependent methyltransferase